MFKNTIPNNGKAFSMICSNPLKKSLISYVKQIKPLSYFLKSTIPCFDFMNLMILIIHSNTTPTIHNTNIASTQWMYSPVVFDDTDEEVILDILEIFVALDVLVVLVMFVMFVILLTFVVVAIILRKASSIL